MTRQNLLLTFAIIFGVCFALALMDSRTVTWDCTWTCYSVVGKVAVVVATLALVGFILTGLIRKKR